jgi:beta-hydroxylase
VAKEPSRRLIKSFLPWYGAMIGRFAPHGDRAFFDAGTFPWVADLERDWRLVRAELDTVLADRDRLPAFHEVEPGQDDISTQRWKALIFYMYGREVPENCARCPQTAALLRRFPQISTAMFSILEHGAYIPPHCGPFKGVLRCHLGLIVPRGPGRCEIRVGHERHRWEEGRSLVFDDTYEHEVWNETAESRVILFVDFLRPLRWPLSTVNRALMGAARWIPAVRNTQMNARRYARGQIEGTPKPDDSRN